MYHGDVSLSAYASNRFRSVGMKAEVVKMCHNDNDGIAKADAEVHIFEDGQQMSSKNRVDTFINLEVLISSRRP